MDEKKIRVGGVVHEFQAEGNWALFTDPQSYLTGDKHSYPIPTYQSLIGLCESIYWKPTVLWEIDDVRIMNPFDFQTVYMVLKKINGKKDRAIYTYLLNVKYQIRAHMIWNNAHPELECDRIPGKHNQIAKMAIRHGGRRNPYFGAKECQAAISPCKFGEGEGYFDNTKCFSFGHMYHSMLYPNQIQDDVQMRIGKKNQLIAYDDIIMKNGVIHFRKPDEINAMNMEVVPAAFCRKMEYKDGTGYKPVTEETA